MKFSAIALAFVAVASALHQTTSGTTKTTMTTAISSGTATATETSTTVIPITTSATVGVPTIITTTMATPTPTTTGRPRNDGQNLASVPVKVLLAVGGGVAAMAQFL
ncbi:hypothetical protein BG006_004883 [Podila minutissima]|uniref:Uncharacterized protein n=1 Tax=Podila minutissima TaxID=64525 RepID=A0A9P5SKI7_9FUNG|nr:hypothetical protein BG006_004883 [Podila minutissima]